MLYHSPATYKKNRETENSYWQLLIFFFVDLTLSIFYCINRQGGVVPCLASMDFMLEIYENGVLSSLR